MSPPGSDSSGILCDPHAVTVCFLASRTPRVSSLIPPLCPRGFLAEVYWPFSVFAGKLLLANPSPISSDLLFFFLLYFLS
jgi:hypothetical protein